MSYDQMFISIPMDRSTDIIFISKHSFIFRGSQFLYHLTLTNMNSSIYFHILSG